MEKFERRLFSSYFKAQKQGCLTSSFKNFAVLYLWTLIIKLKSFKFFSVTFNPSGNLIMVVIYTYSWGIPAMVLMHLFVSPHVDRLGYVTYPQDICKCDTIRGLKSACALGLARSLTHSVSLSTPHSFCFCNLDSWVKKLSLNLWRQATQLTASTDSHIWK